MKDVFKDEEVAIRDPWASNPPFDRHHLRVIELALRVAWATLQKDRRYRRALFELPEHKISHLLREALNELRERENPPVKGYDDLTFERPHLGAEVLSIEGKIRKPDIVFSLSGRRRRGVSNGMTDSIFVECKILEHGDKNVATYCRDGVHRFVEGSYAPWMREGMMVGYVRTSQALPDDLRKTLERGDIRALLATDGTLKRCTLSRVNPRVYISIHARDWLYPEGRGVPGPIELRHLWLTV
jgi:hypothetical protein